MADLLRSMISVHIFAGARSTLRTVLVASLFASAWLAVPLMQSRAAISASGNVSPAYPGGGVDPWNVGAKLAIGDTASGSLTIDSGSDVVSMGGIAGNNQSVLGSVSVTGTGSTWTNSDDLVLGASGHGTLNILLGGQVSGFRSNLGSVDGFGEVLVDGVGSQWTSADELIIGQGGDGQLAIRQQAYVFSGIAQIGQASSAAGTVVVDGQGTIWEIVDSLTLGDAANGGSAMLTLTGSGSRVYVGSAAAILGPQLPADQTALIVSETLGLARMYIYGGNQIHNVGSGYVSFGAGYKGAVTVDGANSMWANDGDLTIGAEGQGTLSLINGGSVSAGGTVAIGQYGSVVGSGSLSGSTQNSGTIAPALSIDGIKVTNDYSQSTGGQLKIDLAGTSAGQFDFLGVNGSATLDGVLNVSLDDPFVPQVGNTFNILTSTGVSGRFAIAELPNLPAGRMWQLRYTAGGAALAVVLAGDYNDNGTVDAADYVVWRELIGMTFDPRADGDTNGVIDSADYAVWRSNFGATAGSASAASPSIVSVPEPSAVALIFIAHLLLSMDFRRYRCWLSRK